MNDFVLIGMIGLLLFSGCVNEFPDKLTGTLNGESITIEEGSVYCDEIDCTKVESANRRIVTGKVWYKDTNTTCRFMVQVIRGIDIFDCVDGIGFDINNIGGEKK